MFLFHSDFTDYWSTPIQNYLSATATGLAGDIETQLLPDIFGPNITISIQNVLQ